jgi:hypothetical protein
MAWALEEILPRIVNAGDAGLSLGKIKDGVGKRQHGKLAGTLKSLVDSKEIRGPFKRGRSQCYFAPDRGPSAESASKVISKFVRESGTKLLSQPTLMKKVTGLNKTFAPDGLGLAIKNMTIIQLSFGTSKCFLHRDVAQEYFARSGMAQPDPPGSPPKPPVGADLTLATVRPVVQQLVAGQGGYSTVDIYDLMKALRVPKDALHQFLLREAKAGHLTIHPTTTVELKPEVVDAAITLPGFPEPFVTVTLKDDP